MGMIYRRRKGNALRITENFMKKDYLFDAKIIFMILRSYLQVKSVSEAC